MVYNGSANDTTLANEGVNHVSLLFDAPTKVLPTAQKMLSVAQSLADLDENLAN